MGALRAEFLKLKRSLSWTVVILLPVAMVIAGTASTLANGGQLENGWHTLWVRSVVFYGLFPLALGIAILASLVWRVEYRGGNWNMLMSGPTASLSILAAKAGVVAVLAATMQVVLIITISAVGKLLFELPGALPIEYILISSLIVLACMPVVVMQSGLSMLLRSFAAPVAVAFLGAGAAVVLLLAGLDVISWVIPYSLIGRATQLGTGTFADTGTITASGVALISLSALVLTGVLLAATVTLLKRQDVRT